MTAHYAIGGPSNSGKSTFILSLSEHLRKEYNLTVEAIEYDVWSKSYPAFEGSVSFKDRPKKFGLDWPWKEELDQCIARFNQSTADVVFADMPGKLDDAIVHMCDASRIDGALIVSCTLEGLAEWEKFFIDRNVPIVNRWITFLGGKQPFMLVGMERNLDPGHADVVSSATYLVRDMLRRKNAK